MIPTMLLPGLIGGALVGGPRSLSMVVTAGAGLSVLWGILVGALAASFFVALGGFALALANFLVAMVFAAGVDSFLVLVAGRFRRSMHRS